MQTTRDVTPKLSHPRCPYCHEGVSPAEDKEPCRACMAWHHSACYSEHGRCAACSRTPAPSRAPEPPRPAGGARRSVKRTLDDAAAWSVVALLASLLVAVLLGAVVVVFKSAFRT